VEHGHDNIPPAALDHACQALAGDPVLEHVHQHARQPLGLLVPPPLAAPVGQPVGDQHQEDRHEKGHLARGNEGEDGGAHGVRSARSRSTLATRIGMLSGLTR
jgi:hypothetical protein